ncbi:unnamed protein product [Symbiodinium natans]|uniref:Uncharacterized protein n=1 Tax=Symbiodinium natans TaxID=878477 RepID=A0A812LF86_9DINO|nr:unnamed protein product [Symbiodinium natans]
MTKDMTDFLKPLPDVADRIAKWKDGIVTKATKAAENSLVKTLKKNHAAISSTESIQQMQDVMATATCKAEEYFETLFVPLHRLGNTSEMATARGKLMLQALHQSQGEASEEQQVKVGFAAAQLAQQREGLLKVKVKKDKTASANKQSLLTIGKHLLK